MVQTTDIPTLFKAWEQGAFVLDVREPDEYAEGHVPGATLMPMNQVAGRISEIPAGEQIYVICRSVRRSQDSAQVLAAAGLPALSVDGGTMAWIEAGHPIEK